MLDETVRHLQRLIQIDTTNPPGNELPLARYLDATLGAEGIETHLLEPYRDRAALVARIRGRDPRAGALLLTAHMDVVGATRDEWTVDPFGGVVRDGYLYGRGAIDDKGMLAVNLATMLLIKRQLASGSIALERDVIFAATSDEESGGAWGLRWLIDNYPDLIRAEFALNEGGRIRMGGGHPPYAAVQTAEKVSNVVTVAARGPGGHASIPLPGNAIVRLSRALAAISRHREPVRVSETTRAFFGSLAAIWPSPILAPAMADIASGDEVRIERGAEMLGADPLFAALLRTGISPTILAAGIRHNVIPTEASATLSVRTLPGESVDVVVAALRDRVADPAVSIAVTDRGLDAPPSDFTSPMFDAIRDAIAEVDRHIVTVPYLGTGATESAYLRAWGVQTFGLLPFPLDEADESRMHGADERVPLSSLDAGLRIVFGIVRRVAGRRDGGNDSGANFPPSTLRQ